MEAAKGRVGRNDRLSQGCTEERKEVVDRVGRNDRLGRGEEKGEKPSRAISGDQLERAKDRVGRNDRLSPGSGRKRMSM